MLLVYVAEGAFGVNVATALQPDFLVATLLQMSLGVVVHADEFLSPAYVLRKSFYPKWDSPNFRLLFPSRHKNVAGTYFTYPPGVPA